MIESSDTTKVVDRHLQCGQRSGPVFVVADSASSMAREKDENLLAEIHAIVAETNKPIREAG